MQNPSFFIDKKLSQAYYMGEGGVIIKSKFMNIKGYNVSLFPIFFGLLLITIACFGLFYKGTFPASIIGIFKIHESENNSLNSPENLEAGIMSAETTTTALKQDNGQQAQTLAQTTTTVQGCASGTILCNGKCWTNCQEGFEFHCSAAKGEVCCKAGSVYCNSECYNPCKAGEKVYCPENGAAMECPAQNCNPGEALCNGKCFKKCNLEEVFVCPPDRDAYCEIPAPAK